MGCSVRVVRHEHGEDSLFAFHEAHYGEDKGRPRSITKEPVWAPGETPEELADYLEKRRVALTMPGLNDEDFLEK